LSLCQPARWRDLTVLFLLYKKDIAMLHSLQNPLTLVGRILLAALFVPAGFAKITGFAGTMEYISSKGVPFPGVAAVIAVVVELGLGLLLLVGFQTRWAALGIAFFTLFISFIFHAFWSDPSQTLMFSKNMAIVGGLFAFAVFGGGGWSIDAKRGN
jgi:putative oxidoreductase